MACVYCGANYVRRGTFNKYCSIECQRRYHYDRNADARRAYSREWNRLNRDSEKYRSLHQAKWNRRRARLAGGSGVSTVDWCRVLRRSHGCYYCGVTGRMTMDHVVPLSRGGKHSLGNVVPACKMCNYSKGGKLLIEWRIRKGVIKCLTLIPVISAENG